VFCLSKPNLQGMSATDTGSREDLQFRGPFLSSNDHQMTSLDNLEESVHFAYVCKH